MPIDLNKLSLPDRSPRLSPDAMIFSDRLPGKRQTSIEEDDEMQALLSTLPNAEHDDQQAALLDTLPDDQNIVPGDEGKIQRARVLAVTLNVPFEFAFRGEEQLTHSFNERDPNWFKTATASWKRGWGNVYVTTGRMMELAGFEQAARDQIQYGRRLQEAYLPPPNMEEFTFDRIVDPDWWATSGVESVPSFLSLIPAAVIGAYGGAIAAGTMGLGAFGTAIMGALGGATLSRPVESAFEAASAYDEALIQGHTDSEARERAEFVFKSNMALTGMDFAEFALAFTPLRMTGREVPKALARRVAAVTGRLAGVGALEAGEEGFQTAIQQLARGERVSWNSEMKEAMVIGGIFGVGIGGAGSVFNALEGRTVKDLSGELREIYDTTEQASLAVGKTQDQARLAALDAIAETEEGRKHIESIIQDFKDTGGGEKSLATPLLTEEQAQERFTIAEREEAVEEEGEVIADESLEAIAKGEQEIEEVFQIEPEPTEEIQVSKNRFITEEMFRTAQESLKAKGRLLHAGIDPTAIIDLATIGAYHIERGARTFAAWSKTMIDTHGEGIRPHLGRIWAVAKRIIRQEGRVPKELKVGVKALTKGQEQIAKTIREDVALRAALKKAEQNARIAFRSGTKEATERAKAEFREVLIKAKVKAEAFGFREGFKVAEKLTRKELVAAFKDSRVNVKKTQEAIIEIINDELPQDLRGKFLTPIIQNLTKRKQESILRRIELMKDKLTRKELIEDIEGLRQFSPGVALEYQRQIADLLKDIDTKNITARTRRRLEGLKDFAQREGMPSGIDPRLISQLRRLEMKPASEMTTEELKTLVEIGNRLKAIGKLKLELKNKYDAREREKALGKLLRSTNNLDFQLSGKESRLDKAKREFLYIYLESLQSLRVAEMIDGFKVDGENARLAKRLSFAETDAQWDIRTTMEAAVNEIAALGFDSLTDEQNQRLMINIRALEGAIEQTQVLMDKFGYEEIPALTANEEKLIGILKKYSDADADEIAAAYEETTNKPFVKLPSRILPLKYEGEMFISPEEAIQHTRYRTVQTQQGFTIQRKQGVRKVPRVDVLAVFEQGLNEQKWYLHVQPEITNIKYLVKNKQYLAKAGEAATNWWKDHLDILSRRGWSATATHTPFTSLLRQARMNIANGVLGYKLSSIIMQPFALIDAMAYAQSRWGTTASLEVVNEFTKVWIVPGYAKEIIEASPKLQLRKGGEVAIEETLQKIGRSQTLRARFIRGGIALLQKADVRTAAGVQEALRKILEKRGIPNADKEAGLLMDIVSSSSDVSFRPHVLARGELARTWFTFQTFFLNRWGLIAHDLIAKGLIKGSWKAKYSAMLGLAIIVVGKIAEDEAREFMWETTTGKELPDQSNLERALYAIPSNVPYIGNIIEGFSGRSEIPIQRLIEDLLSRKSKLTKRIEAAAILGLGIPGTAQAFDISERILGNGRKLKN